MRFNLGSRTCLVLADVSLVCVGILDLETGYELNFFVFYFVPVALVAWNARLRWAVAMSLACAITWGACDWLSGHFYSSGFYPHWNTGIRLVSFLAIAVTVNMLQEILRKERLLNTELKEALAQVRQLSGLLPICASCKSIRNDKGYWEQIETYVSMHSSLMFSHGICPDCLEELYPEYSEETNGAPGDSDGESGPSRGAPREP